MIDSVKTALGTSDLPYLELLEVSRRIANRDVSSVEVTRALLERIDTVDRRLKSYVHVTAETALSEAQAADDEIAKGRRRGTLHGVPIALKDLFSAKGVRSAAGMPLRRDHIAGKDATVVRKLREAGAILLGNLKMTEGAHADHRPPLFEAPLNPWNADLWPGASSSGSGVATAAGLCYAALGTDTGGSIRLPAAADGVTGLKPTWSRVSRAGVFELAATLDHVGPLARSAADAGAVLAAIAGPDADDPTASFEPVPDYLDDLAADLRGFRIGLDADLVFGKTDPEVEKALRDALAVLADLGAEIVPVRVPDIMPVVKNYLTLMGVQTAVAHKDTYPAKRAEYGPALTAAIEFGRSLSAIDFHQAVLRQIDFRSRLHALLRELHCFVVPVLPVPVPTVVAMEHMDEEAIENIVRFTSPFAISGHPTIAFPCGFTGNRGPVSVQLVGPYFAEAGLVKAANAFQQQTDWHKRHPIP